MSHTFPLIDRQLVVGADQDMEQSSAIKQICKQCFFQKLSLLFFYEVEIKFIICISPHSLMRYTVNLYLSLFTRTLHRCGQNTLPDLLGWRSSKGRTWAPEENKYVLQLVCRERHFWLLGECVINSRSLLVTPLPIPLSLAPGIHELHQLHDGTVIVNLKMKW